MPAEPNIFSEELTRLYEFWRGRAENRWMSGSKITFATKGRVLYNTLEQWTTGRNIPPTKESVDNLLDALHDGGKGLLSIREKQEWQRRLRVAQQAARTLKDFITLHPDMAVERENLNEQFQRFIEGIYEANEVLWVRTQLNLTPDRVVLLDQPGLGRMPLDDPEEAVEDAMILYLAVRYQKFWERLKKGEYDLASIRAKSKEIEEARKEWLATSCADICGPLLEADDSGGRDVALHAMYYLNLKFVIKFGFLTSVPVPLVALAEGVNLVTSHIYAKGGVESDHRSWPRDLAGWMSWNTWPVVGANDLSYGDLLVIRPGKEVGEDTEKRSEHASLLGVHVHNTFFVHMLYDVRRVRLEPASVAMHIVTPTLRQLRCYDVKRAFRPWRTRTS